MFDLYILETCPYCKKVMRYLDENKIEYNKLDVSDVENYDNLLKIGGKAQVPFIYDSKSNLKMYESMR